MEFVVDKEVLKHLGFVRVCRFTPAISHCTSARRSYGRTDTRTTLESRRTSGTNKKREDKMLGTCNF